MSSSEEVVRETQPWIKKKLFSSSTAKRSLGSTSDPEIITPSKIQVTVQKLNPEIEAYFQNKWSITVGMEKKKGMASSIQLETTEGTLTIRPEPQPEGGVPAAAPADPPADLPAFAAVNAAGPVSEPASAPSSLPDSPPRPPIQSPLPSLLQPSIEGEKNSSGEVESKAQESQEKYQQAMIQPLALVCWGSRCTDRDRCRIDKLVWKAGSVLGCPLESVVVVGERRMLAKLTSIMDNPYHPLHETVGDLSSSFSQRLKHPHCRKERFRRSFIPTAVRLYNAP